LEFRFDLWRDRRGLAFGASLSVSDAAHAIRVRLSARGFKAVVPKPIVRQPPKVPA
jgi:hypothetical protein